MSKPSFRHSKPLAALAATVAAAIVVSACGSSDPNSEAGDPGKQLFTQKCGSCHVLAQAGTKGTAGPNLDAAFKQSLKDGMPRSTIQSVVDKQIALPQGDQMPANLVEGDDRKAVAAYVADVVGKPAPPQPGG